MKHLPLLLLLAASTTSSARAEAPNWEWAGWGGGGYFFSAAHHPSKDGVIYMGGDVCGVYKTEDHGRHWRLVNAGLAGYAVYSLAVDPTAPDTVYAATEEGLCKSTDGAAHWRLLPQTDKKALRITGERDKSVRAIAVDPVNGNTVYAASPGGKVYKSTDGGETWAVAYEKAAEKDPPETLRVQFGKANDAYFGGFWLPLAFPEDINDAACAGFGFTFKGDGTLPQDCFLTLKTKDGTAYRSRNLRELFKQTAWGDVTLGAKDFSLDADYAKKNPAAAQAYSGTPDWRAVTRMDLCCVGPLMKDAPIGKFTRFYFALKAGTHVVKEFSKSKSVQTYGNIRVGSQQGNPVYSVTVAPKNPSLVLAATDDAGLLLSRDAGKTWQELPLPQKASSAAVAPSDPAVIYATFFKDGLRKSIDGGKTWQDLSQGLPKSVALREVVVSPTRPDDVYVIGADGWNGRLFWSADGGKTWTTVTKITADLAANPTSPQDSAGPNGAGLSSPKNITVNPHNPRELFIAANWRPCLSVDGGKSWTESSRGADISCIYDVRFHNGKVYACAMDEGVLASADNGASWTQLWPLKYDTETSGHHWRLAVSGPAGSERIVSTCSPWDGGKPNRVVVSEDGGKSFSRFGAGLPAANPHANTMWGTGYARALAADPRDPNTLYLGIDGDPSGEKPGGGVFKSADGGHTWAALPSQPGSRRMFFGLAVDPTDSRRLYWGACGTGGGLWRSEDGGATWQRVFQNEQWLFNVHVAADGTVYCPGKNLWRSADHGKSWKQLTHFKEGRQLVGIETDPADPKRLWLSAATWNGASDGAIYESVDGGATWAEITSNHPYCKPLVLRYNPDTHELWAAGVCLFKCKR